MTTTAAIATGLELVRAGIEIVSLIESARASNRQLTAEEINAIKKLRHDHTESFNNALDKVIAEADEDTPPSP